MKRQELFSKMKIAIEEEYNAYMLYREIAAGCDDPDMRSIFDKIASEEMQHRNEIMKRYSALAPLAE